MSSAKLKKKIKALVSYLYKLLQYILECVWTMELIF